VKKFFSMIGILKHGGLRGFEKPILDGELQNAIQNVATASLVNPDRFKTPNLLSKKKIRFVYQMNATKIFDSGLVWAKLSSG